MPGHCWATLTLRARGNELVIDCESINDEHDGPHYATIEAHDDCGDPFPIQAAWPVPRQPE